MRDMELMIKQQTVIMYSKLEKIVDDRVGADETIFLLTFSLAFIFRHPKRVSTSNVFLTPFDMLVWLIILTVGSACSLSANFLFSVENEFGKIIHRLENKYNETSFANSFLMVFGMFFQQGEMQGNLSIKKFN